MVVRLSECRVCVTLNIMDSSNVRFKVSGLSSTWEYAVLVLNCNHCGQKQVERLYLSLQL